jgi:hypothetical protein
MIYAHHHLRDQAIGMEFLRNLARSVIAVPLIWNAITCKHPSYARESEVRLVILGDKRQFRGKISKRIRGGKDVPYIPLRLPMREPGNLVEIVVGPDAPKNAEADIRKFLKSISVNHAIPIRRSKIPYRSFKPRTDRY